MKKQKEIANAIKLARAIGMIVSYNIGFYVMCCPLLCSIYLHVLDNIVGVISIFSRFLSAGFMPETYKALEYLEDPKLFN